MHEMALAASILRILEEHARTRDYTRVRCVRIEIGRLSCVEPDSLAFCFAATARGTLAAGARLEIAWVDGRGWCAACRTTVRLAALGEPCPRCGGWRVAVTAGTEMRVGELEVE